MTLQLIFQRLALALFLVYLALFPGSTITVMLDQVPAWGTWMGGALLLLQGASVLCWLLGVHGWRGALAAGLVFTLGWGVEQLGVATGFPFGRYRYTDMLGPLLIGDVPLAIPCAWLMVALGAYQLRLWSGDRGSRAWLQQMLWTATLVLLLDLQIETVATGVNSYWIWQDSGPYYGVPTANFIAWWLVGLAMAVALTAVLGNSRRPTTDDRRPTTDSRRHNTHYALRITQRIPSALYLFNTLMFTAINLARGYPLAGLIGVAVLLATVFSLAPALFHVVFRRGDDPPGHLYIDAAVIADDDTSLHRR